MTCTYFSKNHLKWWILAAMTTSVSMVFIDVTVLPVAIPTMSRQLNFSELGMQWIINAYTLSLTVLALAGGRLAQIWGLKKIFTFGVVLFALASAFCGFGQAENWLILGRCIQGAGGALMLPATQAIITESFPIEQRGRAIGLFISIGSIFLALGPLIGGYLTQFLSWRYVFWINLPIAAAGLTLSSLTVPCFPSKKIRFDSLGFLASIIGISGVVIAIMQSQKWGWLSVNTLSCLGLGIGFLWLLMKMEKKAPFPFIDTIFLKTPQVILYLTSVAMTQFILMVTIFWAIFFQINTNYTPSTAGYITFIGNIPILFAAPIAGILVDKFGPKLPVSLGFFLLFFSLIWFILVAKKATIYTLFPSLICFGTAAPLVMTPSATTFLKLTPKEKRGLASAFLISWRQFSATLGLAIFGTIYNQWTASNFTKLVENSSNKEKFDPTAFQGLLTQNPSAVEALKQVPPDFAATIKTSLLQASTNGFYLINLCAAGLALIGFFIALRWMKKIEEPLP